MNESEDDEASYSLLVRNVQKFRYEVLHATTGVQAVVYKKNTLMNYTLNLLKCTSITINLLNRIM